MSPFDPRPDLRIYALFEMQLEIDAHNDLQKQEKRYRGREFTVNVVSELAALV